MQTPEYEKWKQKTERVRSDGTKKLGPETEDLLSRVDTVQGMYLRLNREFPLEDESKKLEREKLSRSIAAYINRIGRILNEDEILKEVKREERHRN